jgi:hypothetical protein
MVSCACDFSRFGEDLIENELISRDLIENGAKKVRARLFYEGI